MGQTSNLIIRNDSIVSDIIKQRDPLCILKLTGCTHYTDDPAHVWGRGNMATRWDLRAVYGGCRSCHSYIDTHPKHKKEIFHVIMGEDMYNEIKKLSNTNAKYLPYELKQIYKDLKTKLCEIQNT